MIMHSVLHCFNSLDLSWPMPDPEIELRVHGPESELGVQGLKV
eukprot:CAMPEP_0184310500 /NCGR_PEP_ID=MMETSP1049-20130417/31072_1 /TAXON_ID=77928 /ORGANISM="Proteomonas sulcata, Strain CCMP704" /LENGTH=42 /DNA_ID= /DNA_START= /DNA_END= /DNA_ORIENTATION=